MPKPGKYLTKNGITLFRKQEANLYLYFFRNDQVAKTQTVDVVVVWFCFVCLFFHDTCVTDNRL